MKTQLERIQRDIEALSAFNATPGQGLTRLSFTPEHAQAAQYIQQAMEAAGLKVRTDPIGTLIGRLEGTDPTAPVVMVGSHFDSVKHGGNFDGPAGIVTALETARVIHDEGITPRHSMEFVAMIEEEGARFGSGLFGSRGMTGRLTQEELASNHDDQGISTAQAMEAFGLDPARYRDAVRPKGEIGSFLELHIEQGPILESTGTQVGIVETVVGICNLEITIEGRPDHAGTTPMDMRADALLAAAKLTLFVNQAAIQAGNGTVGTVGKLSLLPGSGNIVPGWVQFTVDVRSPRGDCVNQVREALFEEIRRLTQENDQLTIKVRTLMEMDPVTLDPHVRQVLQEQGEAAGLTTRTMSSGAGHDAMVMADIAHVGLVFVPSKGGRSHCPEEWTDYNQLQNGVELVCRTAMALAAEE